MTIAPIIALSPLQFSYRFCQKQRLLLLEQDGDRVRLGAVRGEAPDPVVLSRIAALHSCQIMVEYLDLPDWEARLDVLSASQSRPGQRDIADQGQGFMNASSPEEPDRDTLDRLAHEAPVVALVNEIFRKAVLARASDIHLESHRQRAQARMRVQGVLVPLKEIDTRLFGGISSRIKVMANLNIMERRLPQDGRLGFDMAGGRVDMRVSIIPSRHGESLVLRILDGEDHVPSLEELGLDERQRLAFEDAVSGSGGMVILSGPTGSGKSTTLHALLRHCRRPGIKIITLEDPVERILEGVTQIQVNEEAGLDFPMLLRRVLRHDPDIIMVGEMRDEETARLAFRLALTGHLVLATVHAGSALASLLRLQGMGIEPALMAGCIRLLAAQRLVRLLCPGCRSFLPPGPAEAGLLARKGLAIKVLPRSCGCSACNHSGSIRRGALWELIPMDHKLAGILAGGGGEEALEHGVDRTLWPNLETRGLKALEEGRTSLGEVVQEVLG